MKKNIILLLILALLIPAIKSTSINVSVPGILQGEVNLVFLNTTTNSGRTETKLEFHNIGSIPFRSRIRTEIYDPENLVYILWSDEKIINPSEKKVFDVLSYINQTGDFLSSIRVYYGGEALDYGNISFKIENTGNSKDIFQVSRPRASENYIKFDLKAEEDVENIAVFFSGFPKSWIVEQSKIKSLKKDDKAPIKVDYFPVPWSKLNLRIHIFSENGKFYSVRDIELKKQNKFQVFFNNILDFFVGLI
jgi:hypothetical protein